MEREEDTKTSSVDKKAQEEVNSKSEAAHTSIIAESDSRIRIEQSPEDSPQKQDSKTSDASVIGQGQRTLPSEPEAPIWAPKPQQVAEKSSVPPSSQKGESAPIWAPQPNAQPPDSSTSPLPQSKKEDSQGPMWAPKPNQSNTKQEDTVPIWAPQPQAKQEVPKNQEESVPIWAPQPQAKQEVPKNQEESVPIWAPQPQAKQEVPKKQEESVPMWAPQPQAKQEVPKKQEESVPMWAPQPQAKQEVPKKQDDTVPMWAPQPQAKQEVPKKQADTVPMWAPQPQAKQEVPKKQADTVPMWAPQPQAKQEVPKKQDSSAPMWAPQPQTNKAIPNKQSESGPMWAPQPNLKKEDSGSIRSPNRKNEETKHPERSQEVPRIKEESMTQSDENGSKEITSSMLNPRGKVPDLEALPSSLPGLDQRKSVLGDVRYPELPILQKHSSSKRQPTPPRKNRYQEFRQSYENTLEEAVPVPRQEKAGFLKIGDIICLLSKDQATIGKDTFPYVGVISGDGVADSMLECIPKQFIDKGTYSVQFRQSLFRIEPPRQYGLSRIYHRYLTQTDRDPKIEAILKEQAHEEHAGNVSEFDLSLGRTVTYGERLQIRHIHSDSFITTTMEIAKENGSLKVRLDYKGNEGSWFEILPSNGLRQEGEPVRYADAIKLISQVEKSKYFLHMGLSTMYKRNQPCELNASEAETSWRVKKYTSGLLYKKRCEFISTGDSFRIFHKQSGSFLSVEKRDVTQLLPPDIEGALQENDDEDECIVAQHKDYNQKPTSTRPKVILEKNKTNRSLWELERKNPFIGGVASKDEIFRIKHVGTGMYLFVTRTGNPTLDSKPDTDLNCFYILPENNEQFLQFNMHCFIRQQTSPQRFLAVEGRGLDIETYFHGLKIKQFHSSEVKVVENNRDVLQTIFVIEDEPENNSLHIYQCARVVMKLVSVYEYINKWGLLQQKLGLSYVQSYSLAVLTENDLEEQVENTIEILTNIKTRILCSEHQAVKFSLRQDAVRDSGVLDLLLKLCMLISKKLRIPEQFIPEIDSEKRKSNTHIIETIKASNDETLQCPQVIAYKHLTKLSCKLYKTILECIKDNITSCEFLKNYDDFLSTELNDYKSEVGRILKETFKHSVEIMNKTNAHQFALWASQIAPINEKEGNINEQVIIFKILSSLCIYQEQGVYKYQYLIEESLWGKGESFNLLRFDTINGFQVIEFLPGHLSVHEFLENNPTLKMLYKNGPEFNGHRLIHMAALNTHKDLVSYVAAVTELFSHICLSRNESAISKVIASSNISFSHVVECVKNKALHIKIREKFMLAARAIFIDREPLQAVHKNINLCYFWDPLDASSHEIQRLGAAPKLQKYDQIDYIAIATEWTVNAWRNIRPPYDDESYDSNKQRIKFTIELVKMTKLIIEMGQNPYDFIISIYSPLIRLIIDYSKDSFYKLEMTNHWCSALRKETDDPSYSSATNKLLRQVLDCFKAASIIRANKQLDVFLKMFRDDSMSKETLLNKMREQLFVDLDYNTARRSEESAIKSMSFNKGNPNGLLSTKKFQEDVGLIELQHEEFELHFDIFLLNLLFKSPDKEIEKRALDLIVSNFNQRSELKKNLEEVSLLSTLHQEELFNELNSYISNLKELINDLTNKGELELYLENPIEIEELLRLEKSIRVTGSSIKRILSNYNKLDFVKVTQDIARNLGLDKIIISFLKKDFSWLTSQDDDLGTKLINAEMKKLYRELYHILVAFTFKNPKNQLLMYDHIVTIVSYFGNGVGISRLLSQILASKRDEQTAENIVDYVFLLMAKKDTIQKRPHDLKLLRSLLIDENYSIYTVCQTNIVKSVVRNREIHSLYAGSYMHYEAQFLEFHTSFIQLLSVCAIQNGFAAQQCRQLVSIQSLSREIVKEGIPWKLKKVYLHFLCYVYILDVSETIHREYELDDLSEIILQVLIPDLLKFQELEAEFIELCEKGVYKSVRIKETESHEKENTGLLSFVQDNKQNMRKDDLKANLQECYDYFKYILDSRPWKTERSTGILIFIQDISKEFKCSQQSPSVKMTTTFHELSEVVSQFKDKISSMGEMYTNLDFEYMTDMIGLALADIPHYDPEIHNSIEKFGEESYEYKCYHDLMRLINIHIRESSTSVEDYVKTVIKIEEEVIAAQSLGFKLRGVLKKQMKVEHIMLGLQMIDRASYISLEDFIECIKRYSQEKNYALASYMPSVCRFTAINEFSGNEDLAQFVVNELPKLMGGSSESELIALVKIVKKTIVDEALNPESKALNTLYTFTKNLESAFSSNEHKVYLLEIFENMIKLEQKSTLPKAQKLKRIQSLQKVFTETRMGITAVHLIRRENPPKLVLKAVLLLNSMLVYSNNTLKKMLLKTIKAESMSYNLFSYIKKLFRETRDFLLDNYKRSNLTLMTKQFSSFNLKKQEVSMSSESMQDTDISIVAFCTEFLVFMKLLASNCFRSFQHYLRSQEDNEQLVSIDLVGEVAELLLNLHGIKVYLGDNNEVSRLIVQGFQTLTALCTGPCPENQELLSTGSRMYKFINWLIDEKTIDWNSPGYYLIIKEVARFLVALLEGDTSPTIAQSVIEDINLSSLNYIANYIYSEFIANKEKEIFQEDKGKRIRCLKCLAMNISSEQQQEIIEIGFTISIVFLSLEDRYPVQFKRKMEGSSSSFYPSQEQKLQEFQKEMNEINMNSNEPETIRDVLYLPYKFIAQRINRHNAKVEPQEQLYKESQKFYAANITSVELQHKSDITKLFFKMPFRCRFLTNKSRLDIIEKVNRNSQQEKIEDFYNRSKRYFLEMGYQQSLARYPFIDKFCSLWQLYGSIAFYLVVLINLLLLLSVQSEDNSRGWDIGLNESISVFVMVISKLQLFFALCVLVAYLGEYFPVVIYKQLAMITLGRKDSLLVRSMCRIQGTCLLNEIIKQRPATKRLPNFWQSMFLILHDFQCLYSLAYLLISVLGNLNLMWYGILLLDIIKRSPELINVLKSITLNKKQLILTFILGVIMVYLFSIIALYEFSEYYVDDGSAEMNTYCENLFQCFSSTFVVGIRAGGGIGEWIAQPTNENGDFELRVLFDMAFFVIVVIILLNIIFGIIIDTFAELRDRRSAQIKDIQENCFICGKSKFEFELKRISWVRHTNIDHNVYSYLAFLAYIRKKPLWECNGVEIFVKEKLSQGDLKFIPRNALSLEEVEEKETNEAVEQLNGINQSLFAIRQHFATFNDIKP